MFQQLLLMLLLRITIFTGSHQAMVDGQANEIQPQNKSCLLPPCSCCLDTVQCPADGQCHGQCNDGYFGGKCRNICPDNCTRCVDPVNPTNDPSLWGLANCTECKDGYYSTTEYFQCQFTCPAECQTCISDTECTSCMPGYILHNYHCILCKTGCASCTSDDDCSECEDGYFNSGGVTGNFSCVECSSSCNTHCDNTCTCKHGYTGSRCDSCVSGRYLSMDTCKQCLPHFATCTSFSSCDSCLDGYHWSENSCQSCITGCSQCSSNDTCDQCSEGHYLSGTQCIACSPGCENPCDKTTGTCTCKTEYTGSRCDKCNYGWYKSGVTCHQCQSTCATCATTAYKCTSCFTGYFADGNICKPCGTGCTQCSLDSSCHKCATGHHSPSIGCPACHPGCEGHCDQTSGLCTCRPGFDGEKCDRCIPNVQSFPKCDQCVQGYHGELCDQNCPENCNQTVCGRFQGTCTYGCLEDFSGSYCNKVEACVIGHYGAECLLKCPGNCQWGCDRKNGTCRNGYCGSECKLVASDGMSCSTDVAISAGVTLAIVVVIVGLLSTLMYRRRLSAIHQDLNLHTDICRNPVYLNDDFTQAASGTSAAHDPHNIKLKETKLSDKMANVQCKMKKVRSHVNEGIIQEDEIPDKASLTYVKLDDNETEDNTYSDINV